MPYQETDDGHRIVLTEIMGHCGEVFEKGFQLEAILLVHEYLEHKLNQLYYKTSSSVPQTVHRKFKNLIDMLVTSQLLDDADYAVLNEFNRLRNIDSNLILNVSLTLKGAKKGDMMRAMTLAYESEQIISRLLARIESKGSRKKQNKKG